MWEELDVVEVTGNVVGALVEAKVLSAIEAYVHGVGATNSPHFVFISPCNVGDSVSTGLDVGLLKVKVVLGQIGFLGTDEKLSSVECHPQSALDVVVDETHVLNSPRRSTVVGDPKVLAGLPSEEEVTTARHGEVGTEVITDLVDDGTSKVRRTAHSTAADSVEGRIDGFLHLGLPVPRGVVRRVDGTLRRGHLGLGWAESNHGCGLTG